MPAIHASGRGRPFSRVVAVDVEFVRVSRHQAPGYVLAVVDDGDRNAGLLHGLTARADTLDGHGVVDYDHVAALYARLDLHAPVIVQDTTPAQAARALAFLRGHFNV